MLIDNLDNYIKSMKFSPIILIFGEEEFLKDEALDKLLTALIADEKSHYDFDNFDADDCSLDKVIDASLSYPFVSDKRVVVVKNFNKLFSGRSTKKTEEKNPFYKYLASPQPSTCLILVAQADSLNGLSKLRTKEAIQKIVKSAKFPFNYICERFDFIEFPKLYESNFSFWVINRLKSHGKTISPDALELVLNHTNPTLRDINNELVKLLLFIQDRKNIAVEDVSFVCGTSRVFNVFELQKAVGKKDLINAVYILENMLKNDRVEMLILSNLTKYFLTLFKLLEISGTIRDSKQLAFKVGVNPYFISEYLVSLKLYKPIQIENAFIFLNEADETLKSSSINSAFVLQRMLINIMDS